MAPELYLQRDQPPGVPPLALDGERTLPDVPEENYWFQRHVAVYAWVAAQVSGRRVIDMASGASRTRSRRTTCAPAPGLTVIARRTVGSRRAPPGASS